ncbi:MAG: hypothetical protein PHT41_08330, partial [Candidatus Omnitrophica bacterium]|nr:hypothetical protein [Candidatus Omnitrophota bacterium]
MRSAAALLIFALLITYLLISQESSTSLGEVRGEKHMLAMAMIGGVVTARERNSHEDIERAVKESVFRWSTHPLAGPQQITGDLWNIGIRETQFDGVILDLERQFFPGRKDIRDILREQHSALIQQQLTVEGFIDLVYELLQGQSENAGAAPAVTMPLVLFLLSLGLEIVRNNLLLILLSIVYIISRHDTSSDSSALFYSQLPFIPVIGLISINKDRRTDALKELVLLSKRIIRSLREFIRNLVHLPWLVGTKSSAAAVLKFPSGSHNQFYRWLDDKIETGELPRGLTLILLDLKSRVIYDPVREADTKEFIWNKALAYLLEVDSDNWLRKAKERGLVGDVYWVKPNWPGYRFEDALDPEYVSKVERGYFKKIVRGIENLPVIKSPVILCIDGVFFSFRHHSDPDMGGVGPPHICAISGRNWEPTQEWIEEEVNRIQEILQTRISEGMQIVAFGYTFLQRDAYIDQLGIIGKFLGQMLRNIDEFQQTVESPLGESSVQAFVPPSVAGGGQSPLSSGASSQGTMTTLSCNPPQLWIGILIGTLAYLLLGNGLFSLGLALGAIFLGSVLTFSDIPGPCALTGRRRVHGRVRKGSVEILTEDPASLFAGTSSDDLLIGEVSRVIRNQDREEDANGDFIERGWAEKFKEAALARAAEALKGTDIYVLQMEYELSLQFLQNFREYLIKQWQCSSADADHNTGELAKILMAGGLGSFKPDLVRGWYTVLSKYWSPMEARNRLHAFGILYARDIRGQGRPQLRGPLAGKNIVEIALDSLTFAAEYTVKLDIEVNEHGAHRIGSVSVKIYQNPWSELNEYWLYCPEVFHEAYCGGEYDDFRAVQTLLYRKVLLRFIKEGIKNGCMRRNLLFSMSEVN